MPRVNPPRSRVAAQARSRIHAATYVRHRTDSASVTAQIYSMPDDRETLLRSIAAFEATLAEIRANTLVFASPELLRRLEQIEAAATVLGDSILAATIEKLRLQLTTGKGLDG